MSNKQRRPGRPAKYPPKFQRDAVAMVLDEGLPPASGMAPLDESSASGMGPPVRQ
jgi:hypothetical protein